MIKKCFTINQHRTKEEIKSYYQLFEKKLFQAIEIFYPYDTTKEQYFDYTSEIKKLIAKYNVEVVLHLPHGPKNDLMDEEIGLDVYERMLCAIDYAREFEATKLTLHLGYVDINKEKRDRQECLKKAIAVIKKLNYYSYPMKLMIENMPVATELGYSPEEIKYIIQEVDDQNVKFILDFGHANVSEFSVLDYLNVLKNDLCHLHISDNNGSSDEHAPLGNGNINYRKIFKLFKDYQGLYCLEILYKNVNDLVKYEHDLMKLWH